MLYYYFTIGFTGIVNGVPVLQHTSYKVAESSQIKAWQKAIDYAIGVYGVCLCTIEYRNTATY